jgi:Ni,Fe-hydrogenase III large subunit
VWSHATRPLASGWWDRSRVRRASTPTFVAITPFAPYDELAPAVAEGEDGDVLARMRVMCDEVDEAERLIMAQVELAGDGCVPTAPRGESALGWAESVRGEALAWVQFDAEGRLARVRVRPASTRNWRAFDDAARAQNVFTDIPIIEASFWLTVAGVAR